ncbi:MAG: alpha/beta hydrolase [Dehalococcoidales bacterium]|nr:alpha/beta hydrolase [Dehalococcoidales bacterium]
MAVITHIGIILAAIVAAFIIELLVVALYPGVSVQKQYLSKIVSPQDSETHRAGLREEVSFEVAGNSISAWLYLPENLSSPVPCIVMAHGLGGTKNMALDSYAVRFREAGVAVLAFDYRCLGKSEGQPRQLIWIPYQLQDYAAAIEYARSLNNIDPSKIALWGTSLSGGHVIVTAAKDNKIACVSAQCPLLDGAAVYDQQLHRIGIKYMLRMIGHAQRDLVRSWFQLSPHKIPLVGKPGTIALMADIDAWNTFAELAPDDFVNEACARIGIRMDKYRPISQVAKIRCPVLLQACDYDATLPLRVVEKTASRLGQLAKVIHYPIGHFDIYHGRNFDISVNDQLSFYKKHLLNTSHT